MSKATVTVELTADEDRLLQGFRKAQTADNELRLGLNKTGVTAEQSSKAMVDGMLKAARATTQSTDKIVRELKKAGTEGKQVAREIEAHMRRTGQDGSRSIDEILKSLQRVNPEAASVAAKMHSEILMGTTGASKSFDRLGRSALAQLTGIAGGFIGVHEGLQKWIELNREAARTSEEAFATIEKNQSGDRRLLQVARGAADFKALRAKSDSLARDFGIDREITRQLVFSARSEGFEGSLDFIARNAPVIAPEAQARVAGQLPELFKASGKRITPEQAINATLAAANASQLSFEEISTALPAAAEGTALIGSTAGETTAALSVLASRFGSASTASDRTKAFAAKANLDERLDGKGLLGAVQALGQFSEDDRKKFLGDSIELNTAYEFLREEFGNIKQRQRVTEFAIRSTGSRYSPTATRLQAAKSDKRIQSMLAAKRAEIALEIEREQRRGATEGQRQARTNQALSQAEKEGAAPIQIEAAEQLGGLVKGFGADPSEVVALASGNQLANLERDFRIASRAGDDSVLAPYLAVRNLRELRAKDSDAILGSNVTAQLLRQSTGEFFSPDEVTERQRRMATRLIERQASGAAGASRSFSETLFRGFEGTDVPFLGAAANAAAGEGSGAAQAILTELRRNNELLAESNAIAKRTASNTDDRNRRPTDAMRATANQR